MLRNRVYRIALGASVLLHLLLFLLYKPLAGFSGLVNLAKAQQPPSPPLTFELVESDPPQELVETPEDARIETPPQDAQFLSDKNARAQDMLDNTLLPNGLPFSQGQTDYRVFAGGAPAMPDVGQQEQQPEQEAKEGESDRGEADKQIEGEQNPYEFGSAPILNRLLSSQQKKFSREMLRGSPNPQSLVGPFSDDANWDNQESDAEALGDISLSTYEWDYAPYLLYMKKRIRDHLYPPTAFVQMGAISGDVTISFILRRDGTVSQLKFINNHGHNSFIDPSLNSIKASDPFKPLPDTFPDPYLELTWTFVYSVYR